MILLPIFCKNSTIIYIYKIDSFYICIDNIDIMTLQQMEYVVAVDKYRHFVKAAESCNVSQSTLSMMIKKLEDELDVMIFDRDARPVRPTMAGE